MKEAIWALVTDTEIDAELSACGAKFKRLSEAEMIEEVASALADEKAVGWMQDEWNLAQEHLVGAVLLRILARQSCKNNLTLKLNIAKASVHLLPVS